MTGPFAGPGLIYQGTWAGRPNPGPRGSRMLITNVGPAGSIFSSDGTNWRPQNGQALLAKGSGNIATPVATITATGAGQVFTLPTNAEIFPGLLVPGISSIEASALFQKGGAVGSFNARILVGPTLGSVTGAVTMQVAAGMAADQAQARLLGEMFLRTNAAQLGTQSSTFNVVLGAGNLADQALDFTVSQFVQFGVAVSGFGTAPDTLNLLAYEVWVKG